MSTSKDELITNAAYLGTAGKGILAADESISMVKLSCCEDSENRRLVQRELLLNTPGALRSLNGVVLSEEALYQKTAEGKPFVDVLEESGVLVGITIRGSRVTWRGPDGHAQKFQQYREAGARFAVWGDAPIIDASEPLKEAKELAWFATHCQRSGLVPLVHPKLLFDKPPRTLEFANSTENVLAACLAALNDRKVHLEGTLLMLGIAPQADPRDIARETLHVLQRKVPPAIPAIVFLSSGQSEEKAIIAMNKSKGKKPWKLSSFFGPPLQQGTLKAGAGKDNPHSPLEARRARKRTRGSDKGNLQLGEGTSKSPYHKDYKY